MHRKEFRILEQNLAYQGFFKLTRYQLQYRLFAGGWSQPVHREVLTRGHIVGVLPYDPKQDEILLIEQFRPGAIDANEGAWLTEIIAGFIDDSEMPEQAAKREAKEEAGLELSRLEHMHKYWVSPGGSSETVDLYLGVTNLPKQGGVFGLDCEGEDIRTQVIPAALAIEWLHDGSIRNAMSIIALQWFERWHRTRAVG